MFLARRSRLQLVRWSRCASKQGEHSERWRWPGRRRRRSRKRRRPTAEREHSPRRRTPAVTPEKHACTGQVYTRPPFFCECYDASKASGEADGMSTAERITLPLASGEKLDRDEFLRRWEALPELKF